MRVQRITCCADAEQVILNIRLLFVLRGQFVVATSELLFGENFTHDFSTLAHKFDTFQTELLIRPWNCQFCKLSALWYDN